MSYRHIFHAGNHGDVLKHATLSRILAYMTEKNAPLLYLDTHAGAGQYALNQQQAQKTKEADNGIMLLWKAEVIPQFLLPYITALRRYNPEKILRQYPGSPMLAQQFLRQADRGVCYELHSTDYPLLKCLLQDKTKFQAINKDGFTGLREHLPPKERRGLVLIDPSYEQDTDYLTVFAAVQEAVQRFPTGVYMVWYPLLQHAPVMRLTRALKSMKITKMLQIELTLIPLGLGLIGSGLWIINPPWMLEDELLQALPWLAHKLGGESATWRIYKPVANQLHEVSGRS